MTLYLKYRPQHLDEIIGNENIIDVLRALFKTGDFPQVTLFHGPTGCGKTTLARIIAANLNCVGNDLREIDSASFGRGIDTIRDIRKQSQFKPLEGPCRVWILDEVHRLTGDAQSALLKALEDTPKNVYYILATTDPQKLISTIKGRCSQYPVKPLNDEQMVTLLRGVVRGEDEKITKAVYDQIIQDSQGHPRNALQILEQVLVVEPDRRVEVAKQSAEMQSQTIELCRALLDNTGWKNISTILAGLKDQDPESIRRAVLGYCQAVLLKGENHQAAAVMEQMAEPFYASGFPGLVLACYTVVFEDDDGSEKILKEVQNVRQAVEANTQIRLDDEVPF